MKDKAATARDATEETTADCDNIIALLQAVVVTSGTTSTRNREN